MDNGRLLDKSLHKHGFELIPSPVSSQEIDFHNQQDVVKCYYPHCEELVGKFLMESSSNPRCITVTAFDHNVRSKPGAGKTLLKDGGRATVQNPAGVVHADYTQVSAPRRLEQLGQATPKKNDVRASQDASILEPSIVEEAFQGKRR